MHAEAFREMLDRRPFEPFEIVMSTGERHLIKHPEFFMLSPSRAVVVDPVVDRVTVISLMHVTELRMPQPQGSA